MDDSRTASCLPDLIDPTYVLIMPELLSEMFHRPHGLLEVTHGDACVLAAVLPPRINLPISQELLHAFCIFFLCLAERAVKLLHAFCRRSSLRTRCARPIISR